MFDMYCIIEFFNAKKTKIYFSNLRTSFSLGGEESEPCPVGACFEGLLSKNQNKNFTDSKFLGRFQFN